MNTNMDVYKNYYWQRDKIRLKLGQPKNYIELYNNDMHSERMALNHEEICLPPKKVKINLEGDFTQLDIKAPSFTVADLDDNYVGYICFNYINERHGTFSLDLLINKEHRGKGYGKSAIILLLEYAFNERRLHKFDVYCHDENVASIKLIEAIGCKKEGISRECIYMDGKYHDLFLYGMTADEYRIMKIKTKNSHDISKERQEKSRKILELLNDL